MAAPPISSTRLGELPHARIAGVELLLIDQSTTIAAFENEIRRNAAHYRLAGGV